MKFKQLTAALLLIMTVVLSGCNRSEERLASFIPVDQPCTVAAVDLSRFFHDFGIKVTEGSFEWPESMHWLTDQIKPEQSARVARLLAPVDNSFMIYYTDNSDFMASFLTARITDREEFDINMAEMRIGEPETFGQYEVNHFDSFDIIVRGNVAWLTRLTAEQLDNLIKRADKTSLSDLDGICNALDADGFVRLAVMTDPGSDPDGQTGQWQVGTFRFADTLLAADFTSMLGDGRENTTEYVGPVSVDFLRYIPDGMDLVMAIGRNDVQVTPEEIISRVNTIIPSGTPYGQQAREAITMLAPYLAKINGTVACGINFTDDNYGAVLMIHMTQEEINNTIAQLSAQAAAFGISTVTDPASGAVSADLSGLNSGKPLTVTMRNADGYLLMTTYDPNGTYNNSYSPVFTGKDAALTITIPPTTQVLNPYGLHVETQCEGAVTRSRINFTGTDRPFTDTLLDIIARMAS